MKLVLFAKHKFITPCVIALFMFVVGINTHVFAQEETITPGISADTIDFSNLTKDQAKAKVDEYIKGFTDSKIQLDVDGNKVTLTAGELGYYWKNTDIIDEAYEYGKQGNVIARYKESKDIEENNIKYDIEFDVNDDVLRQAIEDNCSEYNIPHVNAKLTRVGGSFTISKEASGRMIDMDTTVSNLHDFLMNSWDGKDASQNVIVVDDMPVATEADCAKVSDIIGTYTTKFGTGSSNYNRNSNMQNGVEHLNGVTLCQGETFSANELLEPWTSDNGWKEAGTYVNGKVENSLGGGICQVSTTLYNAVLGSELEVVERYNHSMSVGYVPLSMDAALAGTWKDLKFKNNTDTPVYIEGIYNPSGSITFNIYGVETRPSNRTIEYVSETLSTNASSEIVTQDPSLPSGYRKVTSSGHVGYTAQLIKRVYIDGSLDSEEVVNKSSYASSPTYVTVGTGEAESETQAPAETPAQAETPAAVETPATPATPATPETTAPAETQAPTQAPTQAQ